MADDPSYTRNPRDDPVGNPSGGLPWTDMNHSHGAAVCVDYVTLDGYTDLARNYSEVLMKIDVERGDLDVLAGGLRFLRVIRPVILAELWRPKEPMRILRSLDYEARRLFGIYYLFTPREATP